MELLIHTVGEVTPLTDVLRPWLDEVNRELSGRDYGGAMENLWIEVELHEYGMNIPDRPPWPFRFQKRVRPKLAAGLGPVEPRLNVGHYSVRPTADEMRAESSIEVARRVLGVVLASTGVLLGKRQIRGFDVLQFQRDLSAAFQRYGFAGNETRRASG